MKNRAGVALLTLGLLGACAGVAAPTKHLADAQGDLRAAETVGVDKVPKAALHLQLAREELDKAKKLMDDKENEKAEYMLRRAQADAELAIALSKGEPLSEKAAAVKEQLDSVKASDANQTQRPE